MAEHNRKVTTEQVVEALKKHGGNISAASRELGVERCTIRDHARIGGIHKPLAAGSQHGLKAKKAPLPAKGLIKRYICTSAQNNTYVNGELWEALLTLADYYDAEVLVGTFTYNQNAFGKLAVKRGTKKEDQRDLWYDPELTDYINDDHLELAPGLVWCGEMNILPTAVDPLSGLETYTYRKSSIFPHAKMEMRSIATMLGEGAKLNYTTGTVTRKNYIQKKDGIKAEEQHRYGALVVEVNDKGNWWVRQIGMGSKEKVLQDLDIAVIDGKIAKKQTVHAVTWGDLHATAAEEWVLDASQDMLDALRPKVQFLHDVLEGASINRHHIKDPNAHFAFYRWLRGLHRVGAELESTVKVMERYKRDWCHTVVPDSNHDGWWLKSWLNKYDYRKDPANSQLFLDMQKWFYERLAEGLMPKDVNLTEYALRKFGLDEKVQLLLADQSFTICGKKIECGMHGHLGPDGARGTPASLKKIGRRANIGHVHSAGIWGGLYVAGVSAKLKWDYNWGPSSWTHSHIVTYASGQRAIVTMYAGKWRA